jgi:hypothetical protein
MPNLAIIAKETQLLHQTERPGGLMKKTDRRQAEKKLQTSALVAGQKRIDRRRGRVG